LHGGAGYAKLFIIGQFGRPQKTAQFKQSVKGGFMAFNASSLFLKILKMEFKPVTKKILHTV